MRVGLVCLIVALGLSSGEAVSLRGSRGSQSFTAEDDAALLGGGGAGAGVDVHALGALRDAITDDLSSDTASLSDTLDRLLTGSQVDESDAVSGEAYGDEPATPAAAASTTTTVHAAEEAVAGSAAIENAISEITAPAVQRSSGVIPAPRAKPTTVTADSLMKFKSVSNSASASDSAGEKKGPITPLTGNNEKVAVPVKGPLPGVTTDIESDAPAAKKGAKKPSAAGKAASRKRVVKHEEEEEEDNEDEAVAANDEARFMADSAMNRAMSGIAASLTPQQIAFASQGGSDPAIVTPSTPQPASADRIKSAVYVVLAIGAVIAIVEASTYLTDYALKQSNVSIDKMLAKTYKALMLLGLASFLAICFARLNWLSTVLGDYSPNLLYDLLIVMGTMGLMYFIVQCALVGFVLYKAHVWRSIELKHRTEGDLTRLENALTKQRDEYNARSCCGRAFGCVDAYNLREVEFECHYLQIKQQFVRQHHRRFFAPYSAVAEASSVPPLSQAQIGNSPLNPSPAVSYQNFEFHVYLRKSMQQVMEEVAAVHWQVWCIVFVVVLLNAVRMLIAKSVDAASFVYLSVIVLWAVLIFSVVLFYSMKNVTEELADHYTLYLPERADAPLNGRDVVAPSDDPDDELLRESHHIQGGGCCGAGCSSSCPQGCRAVECCSAPTKQQSLFCCRTASSVTKGLQLAALMTCLVVPAYIVDMADFMAPTSNTIRYVVNVLLFIPPIVLLIFMIPSVLPRFLLATSVASMSRLSVLRTTIVKLNSTSYRTAKLEAEKARRAAAVKAGGSAGAAGVGNVASLNTDFDDAQSVMSDIDDDDSDLENDAKSQRSDIEILNNRDAKIATAK